MTEITPIRAPQATVTLLRDLFARAGDERVEVVRLSDEELAVLDGPETDHVAPSPWLSKLSAPEQETARTVAARGLAIRGVARPSLVDDATGDLVLSIEGDVHAVLAARRAASTIVIAERRDPLEAQTLVLYRQGEHGVVEESVNEAGLHVFSAGPLERALDALATFVDPVGTARADGPVRRVDLAELRAGSVQSLPVDATRIVTVLVALGTGVDGEPEQRRGTVSVLPESVEMARAEPDVAAALVQPVGPDTLRQRISELVGP